MGGHCIGVDPYYLIHKAESLNYYPEIILAGRRRNNDIVSFICKEILRLSIYKKILINEAKVLILGFSFKENSNDFRNTKVTDLVSELTAYGCSIDIYDPCISRAEAIKKHGNFNFISSLNADYKYDVIVVAVPHREFIDMGPELIRSMGADNCVLYDVKSSLPLEMTDGRL